MNYLVTFEIIGKAISEDENQTILSTSYYVSPQEFEEIIYDVKMKLEGRNKQKG